jgi:hypothetical protein
MRYLLAFLAGTLLLTGCGAPTPQQLQPTIEAAVSATITAQQAATAEVEADPCSDADLIAYADAVERLLERYEAQTEVVGSTPRASLGGPLQRLVDYEDEARELEAPECLADYNAAVLVMMQRYRQAYSTFAAQGNQATIDQALTDGRQLMADLLGALPSIRDGVLPGEIALPAEVD